MKKIIYLLLIVTILMSSCTTTRSNVGCTPISQKAKKMQQTRLGSQFGYNR
jgi:predicted small secreted protein